MPRRIRFNGIGIAYCVIAAACVVFGVGMAARVVYDELRREADNQSLTRRLATEGHDTEATVTRLATRMGYVVDFEYTVDGRSFQRSAFVTSGHWQSLQAGSPLVVRYLPSDPSKAYPATDPPSSQSHWSVVAGMVGMILLFMFGFAAVLLSNLLPQRRLLVRGNPAQGTVTRCKEGNQGRSSGYFLEFDFSLPEGSRCQGKVFRGEPMAEGATVTVIYDPNNPRRNALYPLETVRLATA